MNGAELDNRSTTPRLTTALSSAAGGLAIAAGFSGLLPKVVSVTASLVGVAVAARIRDDRGPWTTTSLALAATAAIGAVGMATAGLGALTSASALLQDAVESADLARPPVPFVPGWRGIVAALAAVVGLSSTWLAAATGRALHGVALAVPFVVVGAVNVPPGDVAPVAAVVVALLALALALASIDEATADTRVGERSRARRQQALRAVPMAVLLGVAVAGIARADVLFPDPLIDPAREAQLPEVSPLGDSPERVLFTAAGGFTGPFRMGVLDVFEPKDDTWRLRPFADRDVVAIASDGILLAEPAEFRVDIEVRSLEGAVLPTVPRATGIVAERLPGVPTLDIDSQTIELANGRLEPGLAYTLAVGGQPTDQVLREQELDVPPELEPATELPPPPPSVTDRLTSFGVAGPWQRFLDIRNFVLDEIPARGAGLPVPMTTERIEGLLAGEPATPFELTALQVMLARWSGIPARIGFGYDCGTEGVCGGDQAVVEVRPIASVVFPEVWFPSHGWVPVTGTPRTAAPDRSTGEAAIEIAGSGSGLTEAVFLPLPIQPTLVVPGWVWLAVGLLVLVALAVPVATITGRHRRLARLRAARRAAATSAADRVRLAYVEWREEAARLGIGGVGDPPLAFLEQVEADPDHTEFAWLVVRTGFGDRRADVTASDAEHAEALSATLVTRLRAARPAAERVAALVHPERGR